jgi:hypothetical protein
MLDQTRFFQLEERNQALKFQSHGSEIAKHGHFTDIRRQMQQVPL